MKLILSIKHSQDYAYAFLFWRANNAGYTYHLETAGQYENDEVITEYHDSEDSMLITQQILDKLEKTTAFNDLGEPVTSVLNNSKNRKVLIREYIERKLIRL